MTPQLMYSILIVTLIPTAAIGSLIIIAILEHKPKRRGRTR